MSQNAHTLLLFFQNAEQYKSCLRILKLLEAGHNEKADQLGSNWGVDLAKPWNDDWFNRSISPTPKFIRLDYETSSGYDLPLELLQQFFKVGLRAACLEVFYDQIGEFGQFYFVDGQLVTKDAICSRFKLLSRIVEDQFEANGEELEPDGYPRPAALPDLIKAKIEQDVQAKEMMKMMIGVAKASRESGVDAMELAKSVLVVRALGKGVLQGLGFGLVTVLLFKGMWLWICLSLVLCVLLPLIHVGRVNAEFSATTDGGDEAVC